MRKLLAFGTGAALIGLFLLLIAFTESYFIVSKLQGQIASANGGNLNIVLEDATLEAIFLGIMVALGYGLITQGLAGIRRQELLELEESEEDGMVKARVMAKIERDHATERTRRKDERRSIIVTKDAEKQPVEQTVTTGGTTETSVSGTVKAAPRPAPVILPYVPPVELAAAPKETTPMATEEPIAPTPAAPITASDDIVAQTSAATSESASVIPTEIKPPDVVWESSASSPAQGTSSQSGPSQAAPEAPAAVSPAVVPPAPSPFQGSPDLSSEPQKRKRGRPKGSKKKRSDDSTENSSSDVPVSPES